MIFPPWFNKIAAGFTMLMMLVVTACSLELILEPLEEGPPTANSQSGAGWYEIFFTDPVCPPEAKRVGGLDELIASDLRQAERQVDIAAFDLDAEPIVDALITLAERGLIVRVVTDSDNAGSPGINRLRRHGISVVEDKRSALMHDKFIIIDDRYLWMGSLNYTSNGAYCNNNNLVRFDSPQLAANYVAEMDEMYVDRSFGPLSPRNTPYESLTINGTRVENYFASELEVAPIIAATIEAAQSEILFMAFSFTNELIGEAMMSRADGGIGVRGVFETSGSGTIFSYYPVMADAGVANLQVRKDGNNRLMHHKVIIIDQRTVIFGSFNFSDSASESNDENVVIVHDATFASFFVEEFLAVWQEARPGT
jgi:phosphatidylserine/phosphatidylglycerophosphate/cardiolipin synthase-like enzyme